MVKGLFHLQVRKRVSKNLEPVPARTFPKRFLDRVVLFVGILGPLTTIPQLVVIYTTHNATGVSALSWGLPALLDIPWILYGVIHRERPIIITYLLWFVANSAIFVGAIAYGSGLN